MTVVIVKSLVRGTSVWIVLTMTFATPAFGEWSQSSSIEEALIRNFSDYKTIHPLHEFIKITEPGRIVVHTVGDATARNPAHNANCNLCDSRIRGERYVSLLKQLKFLDHLTVNPSYRNAPTVPILMFVRDVSPLLVNSTPGIYS